MKKQYIEFYIIRLIEEINMRQYEIQIISNLMTNENKPKMLVKGDKINKIIDLDNIELEEYIDGKTGKHIKKYCTIVSNSVYYKVNKPYEDLKNVILNRSIPVLGFIAKSKKYK